MTADLKTAEQMKESTDLTKNGKRKMEKQKKKKRRIRWWMLLLAALLAAGGVLRYMSLNAEKKKESSVAVSEEVIAKEAEIVSMKKSITAGGSLSEDSAVSVSLPEGIVLERYMVSDGDLVEKGDLIAKADKNSVLETIRYIQEQMTELDQKIEEESANDTTAVTASSGGRVKAVFAESGETVMQTVIVDGALMLLSLDGLMAADFKTNADVSAGDSLTVILSDGTELTGKVTQMNDGTVTAVISDAYGTYGENVTGFTGDGTGLGSAALYIHRELKITSVEGTVSSIAVSLNEQVDEGDTLLYVEEAEHTSVYSALKQQRGVLEEQMKRLFEIYQTGEICSQTAGVISGLNEDLLTAVEEEQDSTEESESDSVQSESETAEAVSYSVESSIIQADAAAAVVSVRPVGNIVTTVSNVAQGVLTSTGTGDGNSETGDGNSETEDGNNKTEDENSGTEGGDSSAGSDSSGNTEEGDQTDTGGQETDPTDTSEEGLNGTFLAEIKAVSGSTVTLFLNQADQPVDFSQATITDAAGNAIGVSELGAGDILSVTFENGVAKTAVRRYDADASSDGTEDAESGSSSGGDSSADSSGSSSEGSSQKDRSAQQDKQDKKQEQKSGDTEKKQQKSASGAPSGQKSAGSASGQKSADTNASGTGVDGEITPEEEAVSAFTVSETEVYQCVPHEKISLAAMVDELDISSLRLGQEAEIMLDAIPGKTFTGVITAIDLNNEDEDSSDSSAGGSAASGNTKYNVTVTLDRTEQMLQGMNASLVFAEESADCLSVPAEALSEEGTETYVYTGYNAETDELTNPVKVDTGMADGTNVEILSGLDEGQQIYYKYANGLEYRFL